MATLSHYQEYLVEILVVVLLKNKKPLKYNLSDFMWCLPDLNWGHTDFQSVALPTELRHLVGFL